MPTVTDPIPPSTESDEIVETNASSEPALRIRYRIRFAKEGLLRWISHRDLARLWERLLRRGRFHLVDDRGISSQATSWISLRAGARQSKASMKSSRVELAEDLTPQEVLRRMQADNQPGLTVHQVCKLPEGFGKAQLQRSDYTITVIESADPSHVQTAIDRLLAQSVDNGGAEEEADESRRRFTDSPAGAFRGLASTLLGGKRIRLAQARRRAGATWLGQLG